MGDYTDIFAVLDDYADDIFYEGTTPAKSLREFTYFARLPFEIREQVWYHYCPALSTQPMILQFDFLSHALGALRCQSLAHQTAQVRSVLSVNRESREVALRELPHTLTFLPNQGVVHFRRERDIVLIGEVIIVDRSRRGRVRHAMGPRLAEGWRGPRRRSQADREILRKIIERAEDGGPVLRPLEGFSENVVNLALVTRRIFGSRALSTSCKAEHAARFCLAFPNLQLVWPCFDEPELAVLARALRRITVKRSTSVVYAPRVEEDGSVNPLGSAASVVYPEDESAWRRQLSRASLLRMLLWRAREREADLGGELFTDEEWKRLRGISAWPVIAKHLEARLKE